MPQESFRTLTRAKLWQSISYGLFWLETLCFFWMSCPFSRTISVWTSC